MCYQIIAIFIFISGLSLSSPSFADDISLITLHPSFSQSLMTECSRYMYSLQWRYEFNHTESGVVTFSEFKPLHLAAMQSQKWVLGDIVDELYEYRNLGVLKSTSVPFLLILMITSKRHKRRLVRFFHSALTGVK